MTHVHPRTRPPGSAVLRRARASLTLVAVLAVAGLATGGCGGSGSAATSTPTGTGASSGVAAQVPAAVTPGPGAPSAAATTKAAKAAASALAQSPAGFQKVIVSDTSLVARSAVPSVKVYPSATATVAKLSLANPLPSGAPLVFLVQARQGDRLRVLLPVRPNESQGWIRVSDVSLVQHDYRIVVSVGQHRLTLYRAGTVALQIPVGLGTGATPTPGGVFYTKELLRPPNPKGAYGPYAYGLSGYSTVLDHFLGGNGEIGIHGTDDPAGIGRNVSHGCIRMSNADITRLAGMLPLGVPVQIVA